MSPISFCRHCFSLVRTLLYQLSLIDSTLKFQMVELESHIATLEMHLSELKKSHEDTMVLQQPSSNLKQQSKGMTESTTVLHETFHKSVEDSEEFIFQFNIETIDTLSGEQQLDFGIRSNECEQLIERKSKLCEDTSKVLTNGITLGQLNERCIDAECLQCQEEVGFQAKPHSTEQCSLERGLMIASALFDDPCNHVDVTAVEECYDRKHQWKQKGKLLLSWRWFFALRRELYKVRFRKMHNRLYSIIEEKNSFKYDCSNFIINKSQLF